MLERGLRDQLHQRAVDRGGHSWRYILEHADPAQMSTTTLNLQGAGSRTTYRIFH